MFPKKFCSLGQSFMQNHQGVPESFRKTSNGTQPKKIRERLTKIWMHVVHLKFSSTLISCSCNQGCFVPFILYLIENILQELIISYLTVNKSLEINFPEISLNNTLMTTNFCKSIKILQNFIVNLLLFIVISLI